MSLRMVFSVLIAVVTLAGVGAEAQTTTSQQTPAPTANAADEQDGGTPRYVRPETPEERKARLGTAEDPGPNPDNERVWWRFGKAFRIFKHEKRWAKYGSDPTIVRPVGNLNFWAEIYQENDKYVWVWVEELDEADVVTPEELKEQEETAKYAVMDEKAVKFYEAFREEFKPLDVPKSDVRVRFEESSEGLPTAGSWRNSLAVADINEDGHVDLIMPPQRGPASAPAIVLGDGTGKWTPFRFRWPRAFNYGSVVAADFNKDKHVDLAFGIHLSGVAIFLGDGKGQFREVEQGVPASFPTRRVRTADVDGDGWLDVVAISEGPIGRGFAMKDDGLGKLRAYLNRNKGEAWETVAISGPKQHLGGDWLAVGNFNGDRYPDFAGASIYFGGVSTLHLSKGKNSYESAHGNGAIVPFHSYYYAMTAGRFSSRDRDDAIVSYFRSWPSKVNPDVVAKPPLDKVVGIDRISFAGGTPKRTPIIRWTGSPVLSGLGHGDFDGDQKTDIIYTRFNPRETVLLLGDGAGAFRKATVEGINLSGLRNYDLTVADVNEDKRPDLIVMYESSSATALSPKNGRIQVFLNRGMTTATADAKQP
jgi:FG-GAP-like repeat